METELLGVSDRLLAAVMNGIYQGILLTVLVALSFRVFRRTNAATRHAAWLCTLVLLVLLVVAHCFFQPSKIARIAATPEQEMGMPNAAVEAATINGSSKTKGPAYLSAEPEQRRNLDSLSLKATELPDGVLSFSAGSLPTPGATLGRYEPNIPSITVDPLAVSTAHAQSAWFYAAVRRLANPVSLTLGLESRAARVAGMILLSVCLMLSAARLFLLLLRLQQIRKLKLQSFPASEALRELFQSLVTRLDAGRKVDLKTIPTSQSSFVLGFVHPVIVLPTEQMELVEAEPILRHELAHVRRRDDWANLLQHFILAAFPFHPAVWWISKRLSLEREIACDDYVLQSSAQPHAYALLLANLAARMQRCPPLLAPGASNNKTQLQQRIDMILNTRRNTSPRLAASWLTLIASTAALFAVIAICFAPRIVLAQSDAAPAAANTSNDPRTPAVASAAVSNSPSADQPDSSDATPAPAPQPAALGSGPKLKPGQLTALDAPPTVIPAQPTPAIPAVPAAPTAPRAPRLSQGSLSLIAVAAPEPRPGRTPRPPRAESADSTVEERLARLEKMVESLMAGGHAAPKPFHSKLSAEMVEPIDRKEIAKIEAFAKQQAELARKEAPDAKEIEKIKEQAMHEAARAVDQAKRAVNAEKVARAEQKRQIRRDFKEGSEKQFDELRKQLEILEREREKLDRQIEQLERKQERLDEQRDENRE